MNTKRILTVVMLLTMVQAGAALAQPGKPRPGGPGPMKGGPGPGMKGGAPADLLEKVRERVRMMRMWKLTELLSLDEAAAAKLFPLLKAWDDKLEPAHKEIQQARKALRQALQTGNPGDADKVAAALIDKLLAAQKKLEALRDQRIAELRKVLTPSQQARIIIVMPQVDRAIQRAVRRAVRGQMDMGKGMGGRKGMGKGMGPGPGPGPGPGGMMKGGGPGGGGLDLDDDDDDDEID